MASTFVFFFLLIGYNGSKISAVQGGQFSKGSIRIEELELREHYTFTEILTMKPHGISFFYPVSLPPGFLPLGSHAQWHDSNPLPLRALIARSTSSPSSPSLAAPIDFTLLFSSNATSTSPAFFWLPIPQPGYIAVGQHITSSPQKPPLSSLLCVRHDLLKPCPPSAPLSSATPSFSIRSSASLGTFTAGNNPAKSCFDAKILTQASMPDLNQTISLIRNHSPFFLFHPKDPYMPSSVAWFFDNGALLYANGSRNAPVRIDPSGSNLPAGGANDGAFWIDLPSDGASQKSIKAGNLSSAEAYVHVRPAFGGTATDIVFWLFYPFNGAAKVGAGFIDVSLGRIGEHVGDWEHVTQRFSNLDGEMKQMYFSQHSSGQWANGAELEYVAGGTRRPMAYATLHGHAFYPTAGVVLKGAIGKGIGMRDETLNGGAAMDAAASAVIVSAAHLGVAEPAWLQYMREWGPKVDYDVDAELEKAAHLLPGKMKRGLRDLVRKLPKEALGEEGPTGPKGCSGFHFGDMAACEIQSWELGNITARNSLKCGIQTNSELLQLAAPPLEEIRH